MSTLTQETRCVQNSALGAVLLWRYTSGWTKHNKTSAHPPLQLLFIVLPILFHRETLTILKSTNRPSKLLKNSAKWDPQIDPVVLRCSQH